MTTETSVPFDGVPTTSMAATLVRCVALAPFLRHRPPTFLYTSGRANRCNPSGIACLYASEEEATASMEFTAGFPVQAEAEQPKVTFRIEVVLRAALDLEDRATRKALELSDADLGAAWRGAPSPTRLQELGRSVAAQRGVAAIRYPSVLSTARGGIAWNVAIFPGSLTPDDRVRILGERGAVLEVLP